MTSLIAMVARWWPRSFWFSLIALIGIGSWMVRNEKALINKDAPRHIISLELAFTDTAAKTIVKSWKTDTAGILKPGEEPCQCDHTFYDWRYHRTSATAHRVEIAKRDIYVDFAFIVSYVFFSIVVIIRLLLLYWKEDQNSIRNKSGWYISFCVIALVMGGCDVVENIGMLGFLNEHPDIPAPVYSTFSTIKFGILYFLLLGFVPVILGVTGVLRKVSIYVTRKLLQVWRYRVILLGLAGTTLPVWALDQGQDLLINLNTETRGIIVFLVMITMQAFVNWYLAKLFFDPGAVRTTKQKLLPMWTPPVPAAKARREKKASRYLGVLTFLLPAFAIVNALQTFQITYWLTGLPAGLLLVLVSAGFFLVVKRDYLEKALGNKDALSGILMVSFFIIVPFLLTWIAGDKWNTSLGLIFVTGDLLSMAIGFLIFVSVREKSNFWKKWYLLRDAIGIPILVVSYVTMAIFLAANIWPLALLQFPVLEFYTFPVLISGIIFYVVGFTWLHRAGIKAGIPFASLLILIALVVAIAAPNEYHEVRKIARSASTGSAYNDSLDNYTAEWLVHRWNEIDSADSSRPYPIFLVNSYGGGVRAAAFTGMAIGRLDDAVARMADSSEGLPKDDFEHFVLSYSGISGGTIGESILVGYRARPRHISGEVGLEERMNNFYRKDFLTPLLAAFFGRDVLGSLVTRQLWDDRAALQEETWEKNAKGELKFSYDDDYFSLWDCNRNYEIPLLFANSYNVDSGYRGIIAPVKLNKNDFPGIIFIRHHLDTGSLRLSTAAFLSARFPYISPTGRFGDSAHYLDGGLKDYSGAKTSFGINTALNRVLQKPEFAPIRNKIRICILSLHSGTQTDSIPDRAVNNVFEWLAPLSGIIRDPDGNTAEDEGVNQVKFQQDSAYFRLWADVDCVSDGTSGYYSPVLPLGWQISEDALRRLRLSVDFPYDDKKHPRYDKVIQLFKNYYKVR